MSLDGDNWLYQNKLDAAIAIGKAENTKTNANNFDKFKRFLLKNDFIFKWIEVTVTKGGDFIYLSDLEYPQVKELPNNIIKEVLKSISNKFSFVPSFKKGHGIIKWTM